jgi:hypothetical protein
MEARISRDFENQFTFPDGTTRWFELRVRPVPAGICIYSADIEVRKRPQPLGQRIRQLFHLLLALVALSSAVGAQSPFRLAVVPGWLVLPEGRTAIGSMHGDVAVSRADEVYISVEGSVTQRFAVLGPSPGLQVYSADGRYLRNVEQAPSDLHGFVIHRDPDGTEFIYGARLAGSPAQADQTRARLDQQVIIKMRLDGTVVMTVPAARIPDQFKNTTDDGHRYLRLTGIDVAPNGDIYVSDGYASDYVHRFDKRGTYVASFGGKQPPYGFRTLHKLVVDTRFSPARLLATDRENGRLVHLSLDGRFLGVVAEGLLRPAAMAIYKDVAAVPELRGRVSVIDKTGRTIAVLGANDVAEDVNNNRTEPSRWKPDMVTAPHGVAFTRDGDLLVSEFNLFGRVHRFAAARADR